jgi:hypothetical protein
LHTWCDLGSAYNKRGWADSLETEVSPREFDLLVSLLLSSFLPCALFLPFTAQPQGE